MLGLLSLPDFPIVCTTGLTRQAGWTYENETRPQSSPPTPIAKTKTLLDTIRDRSGNKRVGDMLKAEIISLKLIICSDWFAPRFFIGSRAV